MVLLGVSLPLKISGFFLIENIPVVHNFTFSRHIWKQCQGLFFPLSKNILRFLSYKLLYYHIHGYGRAFQARRVRSILPNCMGMMLFI
jgi:hypothetical protein